MNYIDPSATVRDDYGNECTVSYSYELSTDTMVFKSVINKYHYKIHEIDDQTRRTIRSHGIDNRALSQIARSYLNVFLDMYNIYQDSKSILLR